MRYTFSLRLLLAATVVAAWPAMRAQPSAPDPVPQSAQSEQAGDAKPTDPLDAILAVLQANLSDYTRSAPSFLCKEHVVSEMEPTSNAGGFLRTITDSVFRVRRSIDADGLAHVEESRVLTSVDGKPPPASATEETTAFNAPMSVSGIFSGGLQVVSTMGKACFSYKLRASRRGRPADRIVIEFENLPARERDPVCPYPDKIAGRAFIQPSTMRIVHMEAKVRDYEMRLGVKQTWDWSIDYAPVALGGKTFWMPAAIHSKAVPNTDSSIPFSTGTGTGRRGGGTISASPARPLTYTLEAKYSDYHRLNVFSRIVPVGGKDDTSAPEPAPAPAPVKDPQTTDPYFDPDLDSATPPGR